MVQPLRRAQTTSDESSVSPGTSALPGAMLQGSHLRKQHTIELGRLPVRSLTSVRVASESRHFQHQTSMKHEAEERGASVDGRRNRTADAADSPPPRQTNGVVLGGTSVVFLPQRATSRVVPSLKEPPTWTSAKRADAGLSLLSAAFSPEKSSTPGIAAVPQVPQVGQLRLVVAGLMGSGKSTLCRALRHLFGGVWVNQDEFSHKGKGAKKAFLAEVQRVASDRTIPALLVDKINTQQQHRREILESMRSGVPGPVVLLQLRHPQDLRLMVLGSRGVQILQPLQHQRCRLQTKTLTLQAKTLEAPQTELSTRILRPPSRRFEAFRTLQSHPDPPVPDTRQYQNI